MSRKSHFKRRARERAEEFGLKPKDAIALAQAASEIVRSKYPELEHGDFVVDLAQEGNKRLVAIYRFGQPMTMTERWAHSTSFVDPRDGMHRPMRRFSFLRWRRNDRT